METANKKFRYSIRKFKVGVGSVLLATCLLGAGVSTPTAFAMADPSPATEDTEVKKTPLQHLEELVEELKMDLEELKKFPEYDRSKYPLQKELWEENLRFGKNQMDLVSTLKEDNAGFSTIPQRLYDFRNHIKWERLTRQVDQYRKKYPDNARIEEEYKSHLEQTDGNNYASQEDVNLQASTNDAEQALERIQKIVQELELKEEPAPVPKEEETPKTDTEAPKDEKEIPAPKAEEDAPAPKEEETPAPKEEPAPTPAPETPTDEPKMDEPKAEMPVPAPKEEEVPTPAPMPDAPKAEEEIPAPMPEAPAPTPEEPKTEEDAPTPAPVPETPMDEPKMEEPKSEMPAPAPKEDEVPVPAPEAEAPKAEEEIPAPMPEAPAPTPEEPKTEEDAPTPAPVPETPMDEPKMEEPKSEMPAPAPKEDEVPAPAPETPMDEPKMEEPKTDKVESDKQMPEAKQPEMEKPKAEDMPKEEIPKAEQPKAEDSAPKTAVPEVAPKTAEKPKLDFTTKERKVEEALPIKEEIRYDASLALGKSYLLQEGKAGKKVSVYQDVIVDGKVVATNLLSETVVEGQNRILVKGSLEMKKEEVKTTPSVQSNPTLSHKGAPSANKATLPATGEQRNNLSLVGLGLAGISLAVVATAINKKSKDQI
ncbi:YSIRK-type signal peptide-containing protein [Streptococcus suis]|uniref:GAG-binding domain-containing protein n=1 Tax=Streptococcus suis TaxID=1307 RepID=UPI0005CE07F6|nr:GAG-binding domain-containing protein [Streptococcus suis]MCK3947710.1 YSIRK-type signal peptide-containing protein [Streptococcus suis]MCK3962583.1 YSIRK-type signal peptide-containing protein [Streptococcus suis]NQM94990.1 YSIRK-type signal peptide-containing protein [Streptococcus suis]CYX36938.1 Surface protein from Gram-positive cocci%2C anchor region:YSIRK Gram-positive signal peptide [Streptococcus suis]